MDLTKYNLKKYECLAPLFFIPLVTGSIGLVADGFRHHHLKHSSRSFRALEKSIHGPLTFAGICAGAATVWARHPHGAQSLCIEQRYADIVVPTVFTFALGLSSGTRLTKTLGLTAAVATALGAGTWYTRDYEVAQQSYY